jgi:hypothetical protein
MTYMTNQIAIFQPHACLTMSMDLAQLDSLVSFQLERWESDYAQRDGSLNTFADNTRHRDSVRRDSP